MKVLVSGFEPFKALKHNPTEKLINTLLNEQFDFDLSSIILPVSFEKAFK
jgi:pyroglutamyl-peptidase